LCVFDRFFDVGFVQLFAHGTINNSTNSVVTVYSCNRPNIVINMSNSASLEQKFKIGVLKELHRRNLITRKELDQAIKTIEK